MTLLDLQSSIAASGSRKTELIFMKAKSAVKTKHLLPQIRLSVAVELYIEYAETSKNLHKLGLIKNTVFCQMVTRD